MWAAHGRAMLGTDVVRVYRVERLRSGAWLALWEQQLSSASREQGSEVGYEHLL